MLVSCPSGAHLITGKWIFKNKLRPDGSLDARLDGMFMVSPNELELISIKLFHQLSSLAPLEHCYTSLL
jgi:hypothetical protein